MLVIPLQSGSTGNCTYVEAKGVSLLFDAGISGRQAQLRLSAGGRDITRVNSVLISHDHADHVRCAGIYQRRFGLPVHMTAKTFKAAARCTLGGIGNVGEFEAGGTIRFGPLSVETIPTCHDASDGVVFVVDDGTRRLGILTDLGHVFDGLDQVIASLDAVLIESNHDPRMLAKGSYPPFLKKRIRGPGGHISNLEAARLLAAVAGGRMKWACLSHLSEENNRPELAIRTHRKIVGKALALYVASRYEAIGALEV